MTVGSTAGAKVEIDNRYIIARHLPIIGSTMSHLKDFKIVMDLVIAGRLNRFFDKICALEEAGLAQDRLWKGE